MIRLLVMDVDGTLTDGKIYMGAHGELMKAFDVKDGYAIKEILPSYGIIPIIITARESEILCNRCKELGIQEFHQGRRDKLHCLEELMHKYSVAMDEVAYIGDDILDLQCMIPIYQQGGVVTCPADACAEVVACCDYVSVHKAGEGAVREIVEYLVASSEKSSAIDLKHRLSEAVRYILSINADNLAAGSYDVSSDFYYNVNEYVPQEEKDVLYESHYKYIDIQRIVYGTEMLMITDVSHLRKVTEYDPKKDFVNYADNGNRSGIILSEGSVAVLYPHDAHRAVRWGNSEVKVKKIVGKLLIQ